MKWKKNALLAVRSQYEAWLLSHAGVYGTAIGRDSDNRMSLRIYTNGATRAEIENITQHLGCVPLDFNETGPLLSQIESLDDLFEYARHYADSLRKAGKFQPKFLILSSAGSVLSLQVNLSNAHAKRASVKIARVVSIAYAATAAAFIAEGWISHTGNVKPSEAPDREEGFIITGETYADGKHKSLLSTLPLHKNVSRGNPKIIQSGGAQGSFANILPTKRPNAKLQSEAKKLLGQISITHEMLQPLFA